MSYTSAVREYADIDSDDDYYGAEQDTDTADYYTAQWYYSRRRSGGPVWVPAYSLEIDCHVLEQRYYDPAILSMTYDMYARRRHDGPVWSPAAS